MVARFIRFAEGTNSIIGKATAWLTLGCVLVCFVVVVLRYGFSISYVWMQDLYVWLHALVFMLGAEWRLLRAIRTLSVKSLKMIDNWGII